MYKTVMLFYFYSILNKNIFSAKFLLALVVGVKAREGKKVLKEKGVKSKQTF